MTCNNCGKPDMKFVPAGVSKKTGKEYKAFYSCSCGTTAPAPSDTPTQQAMTKIKTMSYEEKQETQSWGKCKHAYLVECFKLQMELDIAEPMAELWADASMRKSLSLAEKASGLGDKDEINIDRIPF